MFTKSEKQIFLESPSDYGVISDRYGIVREGNFYGITYYFVDEVTETNLKNTLLPIEYHDDFNCLCMVVNKKDAPPHTDSNILTTINVYVKTANATTKFYNVKNDSQLIPNLRTQTNGRMYAYEQLEECGSFQSAVGDVWVLDVTIPHSVHCSLDQDRVAFVVQTDKFTFEQVKSIINS